MTICPNCGYDPTEAKPDIVLYGAWPVNEDGTYDYVPALGGMDDWGKAKFLEEQGYTFVTTPKRDHFRTETITVRHAYLGNFEVLYEWRGAERDY